MFSEALVSKSAFDMKSEIQRSGINWEIDVLKEDNSFILIFSSANHARSVRKKALNKQFQIFGICPDLAMMCTDQATPVVCPHSEKVSEKAESPPDSFSEASSPKLEHSVPVTQSDVSRVSSNFTRQDVFSLPQVSLNMLKTIQVYETADFIWDSVAKCLEKDGNRNPSYSDVSHFLKKVFNFEFTQAMAGNTKTISKSEILKQELLFNYYQGEIVQHPNIQLDDEVKKLDYVIGKIKDARDELYEFNKKG